MTQFSDYNPGFASPNSPFMDWLMKQQQAAPAEPPVSPTTGMPQSAFSQALRDGRANGMGVPQIMSQYDPAMFGRYYTPPPAPPTPIESMMNPQPAPETPQGSMMYGPYAYQPTSGQTAAGQPGLARMSQRFPGIAKRMGYQPDGATPPAANGKNRQNRRGR